MLKCGFYERETTPPLDGTLPGYGCIRYAEGQLSRLYTKAVAIEVDGECAIIISIDAIRTSQTIHDNAVKIITSHTGIPAERIIVHSTHIHTGGNVGGRSGERYAYQTAVPDPEYDNILGRMAGSCGVLAYQNMKESTAMEATGILEGVSFIRNYVLKNGEIRTNPGLQNPDIVKPFGTIDNSVATLFFFDENEKPIGAMVNFQLHHDTVSGLKYCSDYSGVLAENLKKEFGEDFVTVFVNGCCGNINHIDVSLSVEEWNEARPHYVRIGNKLTEKVLELYKELKPITIDVVKGKRDLVELTRRDISKEEVEELRKLLYEVSYEGLHINIAKTDTPEYKRFKAEGKLNFSSRPKKELATVQAIRLGDCMIYAIPGEVYCEYGALIKELSPKKFNMVAELANGGPSCYVPIPEAFNTPIYEAQLPSAEFTEEAGEILARGAAKLGNELV